MFVIYKCYDDGQGHLIYKFTSLVGIFDNFKMAFNELIKKMDKLKYTYTIDFFIQITHKNNKEITNGLCFEIAEKMQINTLKLK